SQLLKVCSYCKKHGIQLIQTFGLRADIIGRVSARLAKVPIVISSIRSPDPWRKFWHTLIDRLTAGNVDLFISNSEAGRKSRIEREKFPANKIIVIHNGIKIPVLPDYAERLKYREKLLRTSAKRFVVAVIANFRPMKGHADIIDATKLLLPQIPEILFVFAGGGNEEAKIRNLVNNDDLLKKAIIFIGVINNPLELLFASDVFLLASHWEGCPVSLLEAMAAEVPVIATEVGGIPEIITAEETGLLIPPAEPQSIAKAILRLYQNPELRRHLAHNARKLTEQKFPLEIMVKKIESVFTELINKKCK
ncbi:MAG: glycosyltransferase family 4 protein, partial [Candidatus Sumerlaeia bacterium]|nr:glycosyltransferase family 4 protein [Candidatus Sumerlaeia bacterium]